MPESPIVKIIHQQPARIWMNSDGAIIAIAPESQD
jgi:hypothetical protein